MSLPQEILDQLLSGYLDGVLSDDERQRVEQMLQDDETVSRELQELRETGEALRAVDRADRGVTLGSGFVDRVLKATVDQGVEQGLEQDHHVMMLATQPSAVQKPAPSSTWKVLAAVTALAASVAIAIAVLQGPGDTDIARSEDKPASVDVADSDGGADPEQVDPKSPLQLDPAVESVVSNDPKPAADSSTKESQPTPQVTPVDPTKATMIVDADDQPNANNKVVPDPQAPQTVPATVLVFQVNLTTFGHRDDTLSKTLNAVGIKSMERKTIKADIVGLRKELKSETGDTKVLFLEAPIKKIDAFINRMILNAEAVESFGFSIATHAALGRVANHLIDPTNVKHDAVFELNEGSDEAVRQLAQLLGNRQFAKMDLATASSLGLLMGQDPKTNGPNPPGKAFILVR